ncbi:hypothetical protein Q0Z83_043690 [Actinoplanes sichuanensis]|nr:hypothetical protein [Actinoplanes sichuanensis]BEL06178.1 hypothetical protein Q0Z83_043690 [Actinoplanes sichuanensis]
MPGHGAQDLRGIVVGADRDRLALGQFGGRHLGRVAALAERLHHDVAVGQHAVQPVVVAADRQRSHVEVRHLACGFRE